METSLISSQKSPKKPGEDGSVMVEATFAIPVLLIFVLTLIQTIFTTLAWMASTAALGESARTAVAVEGHNGGGNCLYKTRELFNKEMQSSPFVMSGTKAQINVKTISWKKDAKPLLKFQAEVNVPCIICIFPPINVSTLVEVDPYLVCSDPKV